MGGICGCCADEKPPDGNTMGDHKTATNDLYVMEEPTLGEESVDGKLKIRLQYQFYSPNLFFQRCPMHHVKLSFPNPMVLLNLT